MVKMILWRDKAGITRDFVPKVRSPEQKIDGIDKEKWIWEKGDVGSDIVFFIISYFVAKKQLLIVLPQDNIKFWKLNNYHNPKLFNKREEKLTVKQ